MANLLLHDRPATARPEIAALHRLLHYNKQTGAFHWNAHKPPRIIKGKEAGTIDSAGYRIITIDGQKIPAQYVAWAMIYGEWPKGRLRLLNAQDSTLAPETRRLLRADCRISNIVPAHQVLSLNPVSVASRARLAERQQERRQDEADNRRLGSDVLGVVWDSAQHLWLAFNRFDPMHPNHIVGRAKTMKQAERMSIRWHENRRYVDEHPSPPTKAKWQQLTAGYRAETLAYIHNVLCYAPDIGRFIWRRRQWKTDHVRGLDERAGFDAVEFTTTGTPIINLHGRRYPAAAMAYFMTYEQWPERRTAWFPRPKRQPLELLDMRLSNLKYTGANE